ncbi:DUF302 domain-containing protein [Sulfurimonas sp. HSL1-2]|uniref:DUF302 domain-containing protein n=1 Tax=Thiomicrolovo zhangzhouensis TaxID=3131933 RepID=UPI0031F84B8A
MMKKMLFFLLTAVVALHAQGDLRIYSVDNDPKSDLPQVIERSLAANGFTIAANTEMNKPFNIQFQQSDFDVFYLLTAYHTDLSRKLVVKYPDAGIFVPMGFGIYQHKGEKQLHVSVLTAEAMAKIIGLGSVEPILKNIETAAMKALEKAMPKASMEIENENPLPATGPLVSTYSLEVEGDEYEDAKEELAMGIQGGLSPKGFVLSNTLDFEMVVGEDESIDNPFDFYDSYSICKLKVIYNVARTRPQASAFAPCTMMMYKKKGEDKIVIGFPGVYNWMSSARVQDAAATAELMKAQDDFETLLGDLTE